MFPYLSLTFFVEADEIVDCRYAVLDSKTLFFTGGLDATSAFASVYEKGLTLVNIWGGDVALSDNKTHNELEEYFNDIKNRLGVDYTFIRSNCRERYNKRIISKFTALKIRP